MSAKPPRWHATIDADAKLHLETPGGFKAWMRTLVNQHVVVTVEKYRKKATRKQHGWYRGVALPMIAQEMGHLEYEYPAVHDALMRELFGLKEGCDPRLKIRVSTADMNTTEFTEKMMETVQVWAATTLGVVIPDPDPERVVKRKGVYQRRKVA
jgi:hypothetical protein